MNKVLWQPSAKDVADSSITRLIEKVNSQFSSGLTDYRSLHKWSIENLNDYWLMAWEECQIIGERGSIGYQQDDYFPEAEFFPEAKLNVAENLLAYGDADEVAIISVDETGRDKSLTYGELRKQVAAVASAMRQEGILPGDRVAAWTPNNLEMAVFALAALSVGAVVSSASPDFAPAAVIDRFGQIEPKLLLIASSYNYNGKTFDCLEKLAEIEAQLPSVARTIVVHINNEMSGRTDWSQWVSPHLGTKPEFPRFDFNHPGFVLFSSGTTGKPKCITHRAAGILLKLRAEQRFHLDLSPTDRTFFYTTCGWMMWNWLIYVLGSGSSIVLYDGSPGYPDLDRLFEIAERYEVTALGISAKYADSLRKQEIDIKKRHDISKLRMIMSTGSVLAPESFDYLYEATKTGLRLVSLSGGTDICGCFIMGIPTEPIRRGEIQGPCLGLAMNVYDETGVPAPANQKGELVCEKPFPSMPIGFWGDDGSRYKSAYFEGFPKVWTHGDFAAITESGGYLMYGRSDATLNSKGVRIGTAEIYRVVETFPEIKEAMAVSQDWDDDSRVVLFLVLSENCSLDDELKSKIKNALRNQASPKHVPDLMVAAPELPRTKSNKLVELAVTDLINGREVRNRDALANPTALDWFVNRPELR